ncbi:MAG: HAMP domain-containing histidine kinase [Clostridia bacterium]|nr:HAMP domain-containing histidine kinase [Clostridia bacterium]
MKSYIKLAAAVIAILAVIFAGANIILHYENKGDAGRPYRVEAERIAAKIESGEEYSLDDYRYIKNIEIQEDVFQGGDSDYLVKEIGGRLYRFDYSYQADNTAAITAFNICFGVTAVFIILLLLFLFIKIICPFEKISAYPTELAKGNLTAPLKDSRDKYFGKFLWGLDLLREKLETQKAAELALQKQNKTMVLSLSHDIKTPLGVIELYAKALEKDLYKDEQKKLEVVRSINGKCEEIRSYVDGIVKASSEDFLNLDVNNSEFYLSALIDKIKAFYTDKLDLLKINFDVDDFSDCILSGDLERSIEALQNIIENAVKYGDGKEITIAFSREDDCQLIHIRSSGCTLSENELPHIFDSFWRGSNTGSQSGSGLGLYICRTLMRKMNGDIFAEINNGELTVTVVFVVS